MPFLHKIFTLPTNFPDEFPFTLPVFAGGINLDFRTNVTFFVGENGSGKSTLLEAIAGKCEFNLSGGNRNNRYNYRETESELVRFLKLSWSPKVTTGFFMRAESFFNFASYIDEMAQEFGPDIFRAYGGRSLHQQSHGEAFFSLFTHRFEQGIYLLDEPEAALSPQKQLAFLSIIHELETSGEAQLIIATHSPILLSYPGATIYSFDDDAITPIQYEDTEPYKLTKSFLNSPEQYFRFLFAE